MDPSPEENNQKRFLWRRGARLRSRRGGAVIAILAGLLAFVLASALVLLLIHEGTAFAKKSSRVVGVVTTPAPASLGTSGTPIAQPRSGRLAATPTPTPAPLTTCGAPARALVYRDDFTDPESTLFKPTNGPTPYSDPNFLIDKQLINGELSVGIVRATTGAVSSGPSSSSLSPASPILPSSYVVQVDARSVGKPLGYGVSFNPIGAGGGVRLEVVPPHPKGTFLRGGTWVFRNLGGGIDRLSSNETASPAPGINHLCVEVRGAEMKVFLNSRLTDIVADPLLERRPAIIQLTVWVDFVPIVDGEVARVLFSDFRVYELE